ncbi:MULTISPECIES: hypothetical protein [Cysteiniphilum]|uniref:hypothetical protein n=1 Tax=Cysteiniphilum TaxID=2056696 RepID=UPI0017875334|nr:MULTISPECIES: hypothetical protein [Cysteiniphilum]
MSFNYKKIPSEWLCYTKNKKVRDDYYYHITRLSTFREFIEHSGLTTSYNRTFKLRENEHGALAEGRYKRVQADYNQLLQKASKIFINSDVTTSELNYKVCEFIDNSIFEKIAKNYDAYDLNLQNLAKNGLYCSDYIAELFNKFEYDIQQTIINKQSAEQNKVKPLDLTLFCQLSTDSIEHFRLAFDTLPAFKKNKIKNARISLMRLYEMVKENKKRQSILQTLIYDNPNSTFALACMVLAKLKWNAEAYMCATHIYFFDLYGLKDNFLTYATKYLQGSDVVLIRIKKKDTLVIPDPQQSDAFISSQNLPSSLLEHHIFRGKDLITDIISNIQWIQIATTLSEISTDFGEEPSYEQAQLIYSQMKKTNNDINPVLKFYHQFTLNKARFRLI